MKPNCRAFFVLTRKPFGSDLAPKERMQTAEVFGGANRFEYAIHLGALALVIRGVGSGKATALCWAASRRNPFRYQAIWVPANFTGKSASSSKWIPLASPGPSSPSSSENRSWAVSMTCC
ncbi:hypothetical protein DFAR_3400004 [Desulfarculales bacterium]